MKKRLLTGLIALLLMLGVFTAAAFAVEYSYVKTSWLAIGDKTAYLNGNEIILDVAPYIKSGRTLVPLRFMESALGAEIKWDAATRSAKLKTSTTEVHVTIGKKIAHVNGKEVALDVAAEIKGGRTFVPLRFISENLGAQVDYEAETETITIKNVDKTGWKEFKETATGIAIQYPGDWKVQAEDKNSIKLETPNGTIMEFKSDTRDLAAVVKEKRDNHNKGGWTVLVEEPIDPNAPNEGTGITAIKGELAAPEKAEIYGGAIIKLGNLTFVMEVTGNIENSEQDFMLFEDMIPE